MIKEADKFPNTYFAIASDKIASLNPESWQVVNPEPVTDAPMHVLCYLTYVGVGIDTPLFEMTLDVLNGTFAKTAAWNGLIGDGSFDFPDKETTELLQLLIKRLEVRIEEEDLNTASGVLPLDTESPHEEIFQSASSQVASLSCDGWKVVDPESIDGNPTHLLCWVRHCADESPLFEIVRDALTGALVNVEASYGGWEADAHTFSDADGKRLFQALRERLNGGVEG